MIFVFVITLILFTEISLILTIRFFRREFQWLITEADECPRLDRQGLKKFFKYSFDAHLGWVRKPNTSGVESGRNGQIKFTIDSRGARSNCMAVGTEDIIATFGDSYTFCRQVNDNETWQVYLGQRLNIGVLNYGVGNYGVDQAVLRYERTELSPSIKIVILGFVPETICRIQSYWKHYLEFGNTFAFKPRFALENQRLIFLPNTMQSEQDFSRLKEKLPHIQQNDAFYKTKFRSLQFRFPYITSFLRNPKRNAQLLRSLFVRKCARKFNKISPQIENAPFNLIMSFNINHSHKMYSRTDSCELLKSILVRFKDTAVKKGHRPIVMVMPQLIDLKMSMDSKTPYHDFFGQLNNEVPVINLDELLKHKLDEFYTEDLYGGHFSKKGNEIIGSYLAKRLTELFPLEIGS